MTEETWHQARLIPTSGISGADEQERRATSALLAVMMSVREFGRALCQPLGAPAGALETYVEVPFQLGERKIFPDGLVRSRGRKKSWTALVETKTGTNTLQADQLESYLDVAREQGFDALITISNEIPPAPGQHPTKVDKKRLKKVSLHHLSWSQVLTEAVMQKEHRGVADPDQAWILGELIRYLEHPRSGALEFDDMGQSWVPVRQAVAQGTLRATDKTAAEVAAKFDALLRYASLRLGRQLGTDVTVSLSRREVADPSLRTQALTSSLAERGQLSGAIRIPNTVGPMVITADLRAGQVTCHVDLDAPHTGQPKTRVNWLVRQLRSAPDSTRVEAFIAHQRGPGTAELLQAIKEQPLLLLPDPKKEPRSFRVALSQPTGAKRGSGRGSFIGSVLDATDAFYADVLQHLRAWSAAPPKMRDETAVEEEPVPPPLVSTSLSSQDGTQQQPGSSASTAPTEATPERAETAPV